MGGCLVTLPLSLWWIWWLDLVSVSPGELGHRLNLLYLLVAKFFITFGVAILWYASAVTDIVDQIFTGFTQAYIRVLFASRVVGCVILAYKRWFSVNEVRIHCTVEYYCTELEQTIINEKGRSFQSSSASVIKILTIPGLNYRSIIIPIDKCGKCGLYNI